MEPRNSILDLLILSDFRDYARPQCVHRHLGKLLTRKIPSYSNNKTQSNAQRISVYQGFWWSHCNQSLLPLLESKETYTKQTGKEQIKVEKQVNYLCTKQNKIKQNQEKKGLRTKPFTGKFSSHPCKSCNL